MYTESTGDSDCIKPCATQLKYNLFHISNFAINDLIYTKSHKP